MPECGGLEPLGTQNGAVESSCLTGADDGTIRFYNTFNGESLNMNMEEMDCDFVIAQGIKTIERASLIRGFDKRSWRQGH